MRDPFPLSPPSWAYTYVQPLASKLSLQALHLHIHEVIFAFLLYHVTNRYISPWLGRTFFPRVYASFNPRTRLNWDVHVVSFVQSTLINILALWVILSDDERATMSWQEKIWGYTGGSGLIQGFAMGYFVWDLWITVMNLKVFGIGMLAHAVSALFVFSLGFRPFVTHYAPIFILYELSSPFLNIHWFCDKLNMTGSKLQLYNGILLLLTFFSARLVFGTYQSIRVFTDIYTALTSDGFAYELDGKHATGAHDADIMQFAMHERHVPLWLAGCYLASNLTLNGLNWFWFGKMIETLRKRFDPPFGTRKTIQMPEKPAEEDFLVEGTHLETPGAKQREGDDYLGNTSSIRVEKERAGRELNVREMKINGVRRRG
ncbi:DUF887-domain-containing protein [Sporormia fimetaria CBS 119925]|uniref:DUF887-domain-containing protein n=1 Tax=Sporormia fimetaria CBS 119925 TaxID=1340428 RepID=A0A6A6VIY6_9PLEO|nr:DUF887-domain-containing protein [Sporormia fimetaria CBS 119925]